MALNDFRRNISRVIHTFEDPRVVGLPSNSLDPIVCVYIDNSGNGAVLIHGGGSDTDWREIGAIADLKAGTSTSVQHDSTLSGGGSSGSLLTALPSVFSPAQTLYVAKSWPAGLTGSPFFTTIGSALTAAAALTPSPTNQIQIVVYPGQYTENLTLVSNVFLAGAFQQGAAVNGNITWTAGSGVNASQAGANETMELTYINNAVASGNTCTFDISAKTGGSGTVHCQRVDWSAFSCTGRGTSNDTLFVYNCNFVFGASTVTFTNMTGPALPNNIGVEIQGTRFRGFTLAGSTAMRIYGSEQALRVGSTIALTGSTAVLFWEGAGVTNPVSAVSGASVTINGHINNALSGAGTFDVRGSGLGGSADLTGITGTCNRSQWTGSTGSTTAGANTISVAPAYPDGTYKVTFALTAGPGNAAMTYDTQAGGSFVVHDSVGGNTWDYVITHL